MYEDEGDNYNYEKGKYATIDLLWNDKTRTLEISDRKGSYPGMILHKTFNIVLVKRNYGIGIATPAKYDKVIDYNGKKMINYLP